MRTRTMLLTLLAVVAASCAALPEPRAVVDGVESLCVSNARDEVEQAACKLAAAVARREAERAAEQDGGL